MQKLSASKARSDLFTLIKNAVKAHKIYRIAHKDGDVILMSEDEYQSLLETLELLSTPGLLKSIQQAKREIKKGETYSFEEVMGK